MLRRLRFYYRTLYDWSISYLSTVHKKSIFSPKLNCTQKKYIFSKIEFFNSTTTNLIHETFWTPINLRLRTHLHVLWKISLSNCYATYAPSTGHNSDHYILQNEFSVTYLQLLSDFVRSYLVKADLTEYSVNPVEVAPGGWKRGFFSTNLLHCSYHSFSASHRSYI
jgi:hypothetical protein